ncbi:MAG TPA: hypothetical protein VKU90_07530 [Caulobacteraceae bacterium]|nr:hypothetical protein [Caulobacteraceae bacterium]
MAFEATQPKAGLLLFVSAASAIAAAAFATLFLLSVLLLGANIEPIRQMGAVSVVGLMVTAPLAVATSLFVRCHACDKLILPLLYDGKTLFASRSPSAFKIGRTALQVVLRRRAACPHCGAETEV